MSKLNNAIFTSSNIKNGVEKGFIKISDDGVKVAYHCCRDFTRNFKNPEEKVRASYFTELIEIYCYPRERIDLEVSVPRRTPEDWADMVIYEDDELKKPYIVIECKRDGITDAEFKQAIEQAFGNANSLRGKFAAVIAGTTRTAFDVAGFKSSEREKNVISDIPIKYGKTPKFKFVKGDKNKELKVVMREDLIRALEKAHDTVWQGGKLAPTTAFDEVAKLLFCKLQDEKESAITKRGEPYKFHIGTYETPKEVFKRINAIYQNARQKDSEVFQEDIRLGPRIVYSVVEHLQSISFNKTDLDTKGIAFERFMEDFFKGKMGQFFTPREIIKFCVKMLSVRTDQLVLDPACGSGGFLLNAMDFIRELSKEEYPDDDKEQYRIWHDFAKENVYGIEINDQIARICKMNMIIHDDGHTNIISTDSLRNINEITKIHKGFKKKRFDIILTNPPFGASVKKSEKNYLPEYTLGGKRKTQKTEILFFERCLDFLKTGRGVIGIVLPDSITINSSLQYVRDYIFERTQILAIISLPGFAFSHYGANVKSSILFLRRLNNVETIKRYPVFMAIADRIGYTATGKDDVQNDLMEIGEHFIRFQRKGENLKVKEKYKKKIFIVKSAELKGKRIDPKGYTGEFKELKFRIKKSSSPKILLKDCIKESVSGEWGLNANAEVTNDFELCHVLRNTNFDNNFNLNFSDVALRYIKKEKVKKLKLKENDILVEKSGGSPIQPVGRVALIQNLPFDKPVLFSNFLQRIVIDATIINPIYVYSFLQTLHNMGYMEYIQNQTTGIKNLLLEEFNSIPIVKVSVEEQEKIAKKYIRDVENVKRKIDKAYHMLSDSREVVMSMILK